MAVQMAESERLLRTYERAMHSHLRAMGDEYEVTFGESR
jgi:hypothetical protein